MSCAGSVAGHAIDIPTVLQDFEDYWASFFVRRGSAPTDLASLDDEARERIREALQPSLALVPDPIELAARAWAVQGAVGRTVGFP